MRNSRYLAVFFKAFVKTLEVVKNERVYLDEYGSWKWNQETRTKANSFLSVITQFQFILTMITVMKCLSVLKPLSIQLQKRDRLTPKLVL